MPQNEMPLDMKKDPFESIIELVKAGDNAHEVQRIQYLRAALIELCDECKILAAGLSNVARNLQEHLDKEPTND